MSGAKLATTRASSLTAFCQKVGISAAEIKGPETISAYELLKMLTALKLKVALESDYADLVKVFGESLNMEVSLLNVSYLEVKKGLVSGELQQGIANILQRADATELKLEIKIDKKDIMKKMGVDVTKFNSIFYLFQENLIKLFSAPLLTLDETVFDKTEVSVAGSDESIRDNPTLIVVSDADIHFSGEMLTIVGESILDKEPALLELLQGHLRNKVSGPAMVEVEVGREQPKKLAGWLSRLRFPSLLGAAKTNSPTAAAEEKKALAPFGATLQEQIKRYRTAALENPSLVGHQFSHLTPLHFLGQWKKKGDGSLEKVLARHFVNMCVLYTANRSTFDQRREPLESVYNSSDRTATLNLRDEPTDEISTTSLESLAKWLYSGRGTDQRTVFQNIIARELYSDDPKISYNSFITRMSQLLKDTVWQYQVFVDGKITKHFEELQKVIGYIGDVNKKISEAIDSITKSLTDALLATVGVVVLTVLAALVKKDTSVEIFKISMQIYSAYLLFYAAYRMGSIGYSYRLLSKEASSQLGEYEAALRVEEITDLSLPLRRRRRQFHIWFWLTVALYLGLAGSIWWAGKNGPQVLIDRRIITASGIKTPVASDLFGGVFRRQRITR